ncbi:MAG: glycosyltransferase family 4 protein [candidate division Zixibacteria bacterium]|nr:glycosyltransferase family 4 protein [candidate division Zixibacteria bacterium]
MSTKSKPRLLILTGVDPSGIYGSQYLVRLHLRLFKEANYPISLATPFAIDSTGKSSPSGFKSGPSFSKVFNLRKLLNNAKTTINAFEPDIILLENYDAGLIAGRLRDYTKAKLIYLPHGLLSKELRTYYNIKVFSGLFNWVGENMDKRIISQTDRICCLTSEWAKYVQSEFNHNQVYSIPPPFYREDFNAEVEEKSLDDSILYCGNPDGYQELNLLANAFQRLSMRNSQIKLIIASNVPERRWSKVIRKYFNNLNFRLVTPQSISEMVDIAKTAKAAIVTRTDPFGYPMKLFFYVNYHLPIIAYDCGWVGLEHKKSALLSKTGDVKDMSLNIDKICQDAKLREFLSRNAHNQFAEKLSPYYIIDRFEKVFSSCK